MGDDMDAPVSGSCFEGVRSFRGIHSSSSWDNARVALDLFSEAAEAIEDAEDLAAVAEARAQSIADAAIKEMGLAEARMRRAEAAQREAEAELADLRGIVEGIRKDVKQALSRYAVKEAELAATHQRAVAAEKRADDAEAAIEWIVQAMRNQLSGKKELAPRRTNAAA